MFWSIKNWGAHISPSSGERLRANLTWNIDWNLPKMYHVIDILFCRNEFDHTTGVVLRRSRAAVRRPVVVASRQASRGSSAYRRPAQDNTVSASDSQKSTGLFPGRWFLFQITRTASSSSQVQQGPQRRTIARSRRSTLPTGTVSGQLQRLLLGGLQPRTVSGADRARPVLFARSAVVVYPRRRLPDGLLSEDRLEGNEAVGPGALQDGHNTQRRDTPGTRRL